jgi:anaerobic magnesium-protoporphyrin IX monomethyl ester cyclase
MINVFQHSNTYRRRTPEKVVAQIDMLYRSHGVKTFKFSDEMFVLDRKHYTAICEGLASKPYASELNIWAYARVDTIKPEILPLLRRAGIRWLALGIESASSTVRDGSDKHFSDQDIKAQVKSVQKDGINVIGNFIYGLPDDTMETMQETLELAKSLDLEFANFYCAMAYPGSELYRVSNPKNLPAEWSGYSQHSYDTTPLPTASLSSKEVLQFRDDAYKAYFSDERYLSNVWNKFGNQAVDTITRMTSVTLPRQLLE